MSLYNGHLFIENIYKQGIEIEELSDFLSLYNELNQKIVYFFYVYYDKNEFLVPENHHERYLKNMQIFVAEKIKAHNEFIDSLEFQEPALLYLYFIHEGIIHFWQGKNDVFEMIMTGEEKVEAIDNEISENMDDETKFQMRLEAQKEMDKKLDKLKKIVLDDPNFYTATNQDLRRNYANRLFEIHPEYYQILRDARIYKTISFFDEVWKTYNKNTKKILKEK